MTIDQDDDECGPKDSGIMKFVRSHNLNHFCLC